MKWIIKNFSYGNGSYSLMVKLWFVDSIFLVQFQVITHLNKYKKNGKTEKKGIEPLRIIIQSLSRWYALPLAIFPIV